MVIGSRAKTYLRGSSLMPEDAALDERQERVAECLDERSPRLAGMYRTALRLLQGKSEPGCEVARVSMICHCMRELMTNLPALILDELEERPDPSSTSLVSKLPSLLAKHSDLDLTADQDMIPVPKKVADVFDALIKASVKEAGRNTRNAAALLSGRPDVKVPALQQWNATYRFFVGWAHLDRNFEGHRELPADDEILVNARVVEDVIEVRVGAFFENLHAVQDMLDRINATDEDGDQ